MSTSRRDIMLAMLGGAAVALAAPGARASTGPVVAPPLLGDPEAPKRMLLWGSLTCPFTALLMPLMSNVVNDMPGEVAVEWRHFPTHPPDPALMVAGLSLDGPHFWGFATRILDIVLAAGGPYNGITPEKILEFAEAEGGSKEQLDAAYGDPAKWSAVKADLIAGKLLGVILTPGLFYRGFFITPNGIPRDVAAFDKSLRAMLAHD